MQTGSAPPRGAHSPARARAAADSLHRARTRCRGRKLFIGGLSYETTDSSLGTCAARAAFFGFRGTHARAVNSGSYFSHLGELASAVVLRDQSNGHSRGFGFVTFARPEGARAALAHIHHMVDGRKVESKYAVPRRKTDISPPSAEDDADVVAATSSLTAQGARRTPTVLASPHRVSPSGGPGGSGAPGEIIANKIFVGGLRYATTHEALRAYFEQFGEIESAQVIFNRDTKKSRGFGFVIFKEPYSVEAVLRKQAQAPPVIDGKQVEVKTCVARQETSPRAPPQTPISLRPVSATPDPMLPPTPTSQFSATPSSHSFLSPPASALRPVPRDATTWSRVTNDPWGLTSPVMLDLDDDYAPKAPNPDVGLFDMSAFTSTLPRIPALSGGGAFVDFAGKRGISPATTSSTAAGSTQSGFSSPFRGSNGIW